MNASVNTSVADFLAIAADQAKGIYGILTLLWFNAALGAIVIDPNITDVSVLSPAIRGLFADDIFSTPRALSAFFFASAIVVTVLYPPVFISSVIINEIVIWNWPVAYVFTNPDSRSLSLSSTSREGFDAVG